MIPGHRNIHRDKFGFVLPEKLHSLFSILRFRYHFIAVIRYDLSQHHSHERRIVHNHNFGHDNLRLPMLSKAYDSKPIILEIGTYFIVRRIKNQFIVFLSIS